MKRRDFLMAATGVAGGAGAGVSAATAQETTTTSSGNTTASGNETTTAANGTASGGQSGGGGKTKTVEVGPNGNFVFKPGTSEPLVISPGTTVKWVWKSDTHNIVVGSQPEGASWKGTPGGKSKTYDTGYTYTHTFETTGKYHYWCQPHKSVGMVADVVVKKGGAKAATGGGAEHQADPEHMGVPFQAHFVGIATLLMMVVSLIYTFFLLKYGESPHTSGSNR